MVPAPAVPGIDHSQVEAVPEHVAPHALEPVPQLLPLQPQLLLVLGAVKSVAAAALPGGAGARGRGLALCGLGPLLERRQVVLPSPRRRRGERRGRGARGGEVRGRGGSAHMVGAAFGATHRHPDTHRCLASTRTGGTKPWLGSALAPRALASCSPASLDTVVQAPHSAAFTVSRAHRRGRPSPSSVHPTVPWRCLTRVPAHQQGSSPAQARP